MTDWDKELAKIDKQLASISDEELKKGPAPAPVPAAPAKAAARPGAAAAAPSAVAKPTSTLGVVLRVLLGIAIGAGVTYYWFWRWPVTERCGLPLAGYLSASALATLVGVWSAVWSWRHRAPRAHVLSLLLVSWCAALVGVELLPRVGYAKPDATRASWFCRVAPAGTPANQTPASPTTTTPTTTPTTTAPATSTPPVSPAPSGTP
jgi:hypothetical protein